MYVPFEHIWHCPIELIFINELILLSVIKCFRMLLVVYLITCTPKACSTLLKNKLISSLLKKHLFNLKKYSTQRENANLINFFIMPKGERDKSDFDIK